MTRAQQKDGYALTNKDDEGDDTGEWDGRAFAPQGNKEICRPYLYHEPESSGRAKKGNWSGWGKVPAKILTPSHR